jgi:hypothetical protein
MNRQSVVCPVLWAVDEELGAQPKLLPWTRTYRSMSLVYVGQIGLKNR